MHDMAIALNREFFGRAYGADFGNPAHVVPSQIQQHEMLGQLFGIGQKISLQGLIVFSIGAALARAGNGANSDLIVH